MVLKPAIIPFAQWTPDDPALSPGHATAALGVIPAEKGYRPFPSPVEDGDALPDQPTGALSFLGPTDNLLTLAGTKDALYLRENNRWTKQSGTFHGENGWSFTIYGNTVIAANGVDETMAAPKGAVMNFTPLNGAPKASVAAVVGNFVMLGALPGQPGTVQWSAIDDPFTWPAPGSDSAQYKQSDLQVFPDIGKVQAIATGMSGYDGLVFGETGIFRLQYVGPPYIFQASPVDKMRGTAATRSVVQAENLVYFLAEDGFFATDGGALKDIGAEKINAWWRENADYMRRHKTLGVYDLVGGVVVWAFSSVDCQAEHFDRLLLYSPSLERFSLIKTDLSLLYLDAGRGVTLEELDAYGPLDQLPFTLDAKKLMAGVRVLSGFNLRRKTVIFSGLPQEAEIETEEKGGERMMIHAARPLIDAAEAQVSIRYRDFQGDGLKEKACGKPSRLDGLCHAHLSTRYARASVTIPAGQNWQNAVGVELLVEQEGGL